MSDYDNNIIQIAGYSINEVWCYFTDQTQIDLISSLKKGDTITITGVVDDPGIGNVILNQCNID